MRFNLPQQWTITKSTNHVNDDEIGESATFDDYLINPNSDNELFSLIEVEIETSRHEGLFREAIEYEANAYLDNLQIPYSLKPALDELIHECTVSGQTAYYYVNQRVGEVSAKLRFFSESPTYDTVFITVHIKDWEEGLGEYSAVEFIKDFIVFD